MMNKKRTCTIGRIKYALFVPLAVALLLASNISCVSTENNEEVISPASEEQATSSRTVAVPEGEVFQVVEEMPEFPGGLAECIKFLGKNTKYPANAQKNNVQGRVIVQLVITKDGDVAQPKVVRGVDPELDAEALRVISLMPKWKPGKQKGEAVNVKYTIPVTFRLNGSDSDAKEVKKTATNTDPNNIHQVCDEMPEFPGGMGECMKFIKENLKYPITEPDTQGRVIVQFIINRDGSASDAKVVRGIHPDLDKEALRIVSIMPKWKPGKQKGETVRVMYTIPVTFRLQ